MAIRIITDEVKIHKYFQCNDEFITTKTAFFTEPNCDNLLVCFAEHHKEPADYKDSPIILEALEHDIGIVYVCDKMPIKPIKHPNLVYLETGWKWYIHTLFFNPLIFRGVIYNIRSTNLATRLSKAFSCFTKYKIPEITSLDKLEKVTHKMIKSKEHILLEIKGGLGDHIMCLPTIKHLYLNKIKVSVLVPSQYKDLFKEQPYVYKVYTNRSTIDISKYSDIKLIDFGQILNDYRLDLNKKNRILSIAEFCGVNPIDIKDKKPDINIPKDILANIEQKYTPYKHKLFLGWDSNRVDARLPLELAQNMIYRLKAKGFTLFTTSVRETKFLDCIDLSKKLTTLELIALINTMDYVLTVDTSFLHIAGALGKATVCLMHYFDPEWRCSFYPTVTAFTPNVDCFPCWAGQVVETKKKRCMSESCFNFFKWDNIMDFLIQLKKKEKKTSNNILIETEDGLGDVLMSIPSAYTWYKKGYNIYYYVKQHNKDILNNIPFIKEVIVDKFDLNKINLKKHFVLSHRLSNYNLPFNCQNRIYASAHLCELKKEELAIKAPIISLTEDEILYGINALKGLDNTVLISGYACSQDRRLKEEYVQSLINRLNKIGYNPVVVSMECTTYMDCLNLTGKTTIRQLFSIINAVEYVITVDTGILHIAGALNKKTLGLFGPINGEWRCDTYDKCRYLQAPVACSPCSDKQGVNIVNRKCKTEIGKCMTYLKPDLIMKRFKRLTEEL